MTLGRQWDDRLKIWDEALSKEFFIPGETFPVEGFVTKDRLCYEEAVRRDFSPFPAGTQWGAKWEYGWFKAAVTISEAEEGHRIMLHLGVGSEMLVYVNGKPVGSIDKKHSTVELCKCAKPGTTYEVVAECYAGHGVRREEGGIYDRDTVTVPEPSLTQVTVQKNFTGIFDEEIFSAYMDFHVLYGLVKILPQDSYRAVSVAKGLKDFTNSTDLEAGRSERRAMILSEAKKLGSLLDKHNGDSVPEYAIFGQSHLDLAWLWTMEETRRKVARTYSNQLALAGRYPEHTFLVCEPILLDYLREHYPNLYEEVKTAVKNGRFFADGATYVESDMNLISGESMVRQLLYGKNWFKDELQTDSRMLWLPDTFGFAGSLPQIMKGCEVDYFATQKLLRADPECELFPFTNFWWEGIDGTKVLSHIYKKNNCNLTVDALDARWREDNRHNDDIGSMIFPYGFGDGGGGATEEMVETIRRCRDLEGLPRCKVESPEDYFKMLSEHELDNTYYGELYLAWHRGTYTAQAALKNGNRRCEFALRDAEMLISLLILEGKTSEMVDKAKEKVHDLWKELLVMQFHDILAGTSIEQVNIEAKQTLANILFEADRLSKELLKELAGDKGVCFNSLSWNRETEAGMLPSVGYRLLSKSAEKKSSKKITLTKDTDGLVVKNEFFTAVISGCGTITSLVDNRSGFEYVEEGKALNTLRMYRDVNTCYDAWELGSMYEENEEKLPCSRLTDVAEEEGRVILTLNCTTPYMSFDQKVVFSADSSRIDFITDIDWQERHRLLKADFPTGIFTKEMVSEIGYGAIKRPTHKSRQYDRDLYEVSQHKYSFMTDGRNGLAILNDGKYGISGNDSRMSLTLLRAPLIPDMTADKGKHHFTYAILPFSGPADESRVIEEAYELNTAPVCLEGLSDREAEKSFLSLEGGKVVLETMKPSENDRKVVVLRLYEACGVGCKTKLILADSVARAVAKVYTANMLEKKSGEIMMDKGTALLEFRPFEIKTILLELK